MDHGFQPFAGSQKAERGQNRPRAEAARGLERILPPEGAIGRTMFDDLDNFSRRMVLGNKPVARQQAHYHDP
ncbi:hypothetical protein [Allopontixanthobacter sediminis]|uniref:hypothetical protein n=1 Tax=Allopontixanthobacter sediminis TaxID=1689985 RepID=UPI001E3541B7|nr:hypothetical protein [Allopontixanthobacter sediminis]